MSSKQQTNMYARIKKVNEYHNIKNDQYKLIYYKNIRMRFLITNGLEKVLSNCNKANVKKAYRALLFNRFLISTVLYIYNKGEI